MGGLGGGGYPRGAPLGTLTIVGHGRGPGAELGTARTCEKLAPKLLHFRQEAAVLGAGVLVEISLRSRKMRPAGEEGPGKPPSHLLVERQGLAVCADHRGLSPPGKLAA